MLTPQQIQSILVGYCNSLYCQGVTELFRDYHDDIDLTFDDGLVFDIAIARESVDLLKVLLDFYRETKLQDDPKSLEYKLAYIQLRHMLDDALETHSVRSSIKEVISPYLTNDEESDNEQDLEGFDDVYTVDPGYHSALHKSYSEPYLIQHQQEVASKSLLHSSSESLISPLDSSGSDVHDTSNLGQESVLGADF